MHATRVQSVYLAVSFIAAVLLAPAQAAAQCAPSDQALPNPSPWTAAAAFIKVSQLIALECLGGDNDLSKLAAAVKKTLVVPPNEKDPAAYRQAAKAALTLIAEYLTDTVTPASDAKLGDLTLQVRSVIATLGSGVTPALPTAWDLDANGTISALPLPAPRTFKSDLDAACATRDAACTNAFETFKVVLSVSRLTRRALNRSETDIFRALFAENVKRDKSWNDYFERARSQYFWELALNSARMKDDRPDFAPGVKGGFRSVPTSQVLFLHPYAAMEYAGDEAEGNKVNPTVLVDVLGYNRWSWKADGSMGFAMGGSIILAAADHVTTDDIAWGLMLHVNHSISAGLVLGGGDKPTIVMSGDAAKLWTKVSEAAKTRIKALQ